MKIITRYSMAADAANAWKEQYCQRGIWRWIISGATEEVYKKLLSLGSAPVPEDVDKAIGNGTWTCCHCDECQCEADAVVQLGQQPDDESSTALICWDCIQDATSMFDGNTNDGVCRRIGEQPSPVAK